MSKKKEPKILTELKKNPCSICGKKNVDIHHIKTRGSGGKDVEWNLVPLCREHHSELHQIGPSKFFRKYPFYKILMRSKGWEFIGGKLKNVKYKL